MVVSFCVILMAFISILTSDERINKTSSGYMAQSTFQNPVRTCTNGERIVDPFGELKEKLQKLKGSERNILATEIRKLKGSERNILPPGVSVCRETTTDTGTGECCTPGNITVDAQDFFGQTFSTLLYTTGDPTPSCGYQGGYSDEYFTAYGDIYIDWNGTSWEMYKTDGFSMTDMYATSLSSDPCDPTGDYGGTIVK